MALLQFILILKLNANLMLGLDTVYQSQFPAALHGLKYGAYQIWATDEQTIYPSKPFLMENKKVFSFEQTDLISPLLSWYSYY